MHCPKEYRNWVSRMKRNFKKLKSFHFDNPEMERKLNTSKKNYKRKRKTEY